MWTGNSAVAAMVSQGGKSEGASASRAAAFADAARHSRRVRALKTLLPAFAGLLVTVFALWSWAARPELPIAVAVDDAALADGRLVMTNPQLGGVNKDNQRYAMTAARAIQDTAKADLIELEEIDAMLPVTKDSRAHVVTERGLYDRAAGTMKITTPVTATTTDGMVAKLADAMIDMETGGLVTGKPVDITIRGSHITADSMSVAERGGVITFERRVRLTVKPEAVRRTGKEGETHGAN